MPNFFIGKDGRVSIGMKPSKSLPSDNRGQLEVDGVIYSKGVPLVSSHVGQIILTTTLDTASKVQAVYGGTWVAWGQGRLIAGVGSTTDAAGNSITMTNGETGGQKTHNHTTAGHTLTISEMPSHTHTQNSHSHTTYNRWNTYCAGSCSGYNSPANGGNQDGWQQDYTGGTTATNQNTGGGGSHSHGDTGTTNNWPPYIAVYMWKRTA